MAMAMAMASTVRPSLPHFSAKPSSTSSSPFPPRCFPLLSDKPSSSPSLYFIHPSPYPSNRLVDQSRITAVPEEDRAEETESTENFIGRSEATLGKLFGGTVWFSVLLISLFLFAGGYIYLLVNFADFSDIPIFAVR